jgi:hypothetical protein
MVPVAASSTLQPRPSPATPSLLPSLRHLQGPRAESSRQCGLELQAAFPAGRDPTVGWGLRRHLSDREIARATGASPSTVRDWLARSGSSSCPRWSTASHASPRPARQLQAQPVPAPTSTIAAGRDSPGLLLRDLHSRKLPVRSASGDRRSPRRGGNQRQASCPSWSGAVSHGGVRAPVERFGYPWLPPMSAVGRTVALRSS